MKHRSWFLCGVGVLAIVALSSCATRLLISNIDFADPTLRDAVLASGYVYADEVRTIDLYDMGIMDLGGVEHFANMYHINVRGNAITEVGPLAGMTNITAVSIAGNQVTDISPLAGLTNVSWLDMWGNPIVDFSSVATMTGVTELCLGGAGVAPNLGTLEMLAGKTGMTRLLIGDAMQSDLTVLGTLVNLKELHYRSAGLTDIGVLAHLTRLEVLNLGINDISDVTPLSSLTGLTSLCLSDNDITDVSALSSLVNLTELDISYNAIPQANIDALAAALPGCTIVSDNQRLTV